MLEMKDVSYKEVLCKYQNSSFEYLCKINNVQNLGDVYNVYKGYIGKEKNMLDRDFHELFKRLKLTNLRGGSPDIYELAKYTNDNLYYNDKENYGNVLLFDTPTSKVSNTFSDVKKMRMDDIKYDITHSMINGFNYLRFICNRIGKDKLLIIQRAINNYTAQIERQALLIDDRNINLFSYQKEERVKEISNSIVEIVLYLMDNASELLWGSINEHRYDLYISSIKNNNLRDREIRNILIDYISNYVTLDEANSLSDDMTLLKRFIVR